MPFRLGDGKWEVRVSVAGVAVERFEGSVVLVLVHVEE